MVDIADVHARDTEHDQPTQQLAYRAAWPVAHKITNVVDSASNSATTGYYGGSLPDHSQHWTDYLNSMWTILPNGKQQGFIRNPDPTPVAGMISQDQDAVTGNGENPWEVVQHNFRRMWLKGAPPSTYKLPHP